MGGLWSGKRHSLAGPVHAWHVQAVTKSKVAAMPMLMIWPPTVVPCQNYADIWIYEITKKIQIKICYCRKVVLKWGFETFLQNG